ncbi:DNA polymerase domain-containing protein [Halalkalirubrum salinum]|uniref:DNA polymerase domain-containing protein n=1 Tax=Halalkalirubrum salinum TaxID=2563889 RepID=UPI0010FB1494|nr:DNA polymerase domain-containing protein [Halalkalirubrum salinum]
MTQSDLGQFGSASDPESAADVAEAATVAGNGEGHVSDVVNVEDARFPDATGYVELAITQVDYTIEGSGRSEYPVIHVFGRTAEGTAEHVRVLGFEPYFYTPTETLDTDPVEEYDVILDARDTDENGDRFESIRGEALTKIIARTPRDVGQIRDDFEHYEADILFPNRFLIDKGLGGGIRVPARRLEDDGPIQIPHEEAEPAEVDADIRVNMFDIEVDDRNGFPEDGEEPIVCLTSHDSLDDTYIGWLYEAPVGDGRSPDDLSEYEPLREDTDIEIRSFDSEEAMLEGFLEYIEQTDPDLLSGWNFEDFDAPYLLDRMELLNPRTDVDLSIERLSRVDEVWRSGWGGPDIKGRVVFDLLYAYKRTQFTELESYRLDAVGELELDVGKERYSGDIGDLWENDPTRLLEYNVRDVELCVEIDRKQAIIPFWDEVRKFVGCKLEDAPTPGDAVDVYVLHKAHGKFALPTKGQQETEDFEGGAVFDPITGVRENVTVLDLKSLYPMCMVTINAGPETKVEEDFDGETYRAPNGTRFRKEPDGIMREMVDELLTEREEKKSLRNEYDPGSEPYVQYDRQQGAVKVIMNCFTPDTDVLTPEGVRSITELDVGDHVYSLDPDTMTMQVKPVTETHSYPEYRGDLVDLDTDGVDFRVTPNHRMLVRDLDEDASTGKGWEFIEAGDLDADGHYELPQGWAYDEPIDSAETLDLRELAEDTTGIARIETDGSGAVAAPTGPQTGKERVDRVNHSDRVNHVDRAAFVKLLGWYITGGELTPTETDPYQITISVDDRSNLDAVEAVVDELVSNYHRDDGAVHFSSERLYRVLERCCGSSEKKTIPDVVFESSKDVRRAFLDVLVAGGGQYEDGGRSFTYTTESQDLRDDVLRLCLTLGHTGQYTREEGVWHVRSDQAQKPTVRMDRDSSIATATDGVYCVTVADNHTLLAGRNGTFQFVGQSLYGVTGWDRFRLYDKEGAAAVTATGREVINFTETAANELDYDVAYGDSVTGDRPVVVRDPDGMMQVKPIRELFAMATAEPAESDLVVTADGGVVSETQRGKNRRSLPGWEALSLADNGTPEWQPISQVIRHQTDTPVVRLQHKFGESETTTDHSYIVEEDGRYVESSPGDVTEPLRIPDVPAVETIETIDVYEVLSGYTRAYADGRSVGTANAETKVNRVHADDDRVWFGHAHHGALDTKVTVQRYIDLNSEDGKALVRLLAAYVTEGSASTIETTDTKFGVSISESRRSWLQQLQSDYQRLFEGAKTSIISSDSKTKRTVEWNDGEASTTYNDETLKLQMMNELSAVFFREFAGQTSRGKRVPNCVYHLPEELQALFITTAVEGDGSRKFPRYSDEYCERNFDFETTSRELAAGLSMLLTQRGQKHSLKYRSEKKSYTIRTCDFYRSGRDPVVEQIEHDGYVYDLSVETNQNFVDGVGGIVLHNTDSVMLELGRDVEKSKAIDQSFDIEEYINGRYDDFAHEELNAEVHRFQIEFEKLYRRFFQAGRKKRYAGHIIWKEGKDVDDIDITGFEYKRSDIAQITKEVQLNVIETIVTGEDIEADLEEVKTYLNEIITGFLNGERSLEEIGIPGGIGKRLSNYDTDTAQVRGAKYANHMLGTNFDRGSKPKRLYLKKVHPDFWQRMENERGLNPQTDLLYGEFKRNPDVICFEYADQVPAEFEIDWEKMLEKTLKGPIERVIEALGMSWDEVKSGQEQTGLGSFM